MENQTKIQSKCGQTHRDTHNPKKKKVLTDVIAARKYFISLKRTAFHADFILCKMNKTWDLKKKIKYVSTEEKLLFA